MNPDKAEVMLIANGDSLEGLEPPVFIGVELAFPEVAKILGILRQPCCLRSRVVQRPRTSSVCCVWFSKAEIRWLRKQHS